MATEDCAICGESVPFAATTHVLVNPKHVDGVADHYVCRACYDEHLEGLFVALEGEPEDVPTTGSLDSDTEETAEPPDAAPNSAETE